MSNPNAVVVSFPTIRQLASFDLQRAGDIFDVTTRRRLIKKDLRTGLFWSILSLNRCSRVRAHVASMAAAKVRTDSLIRFLLQIREVPSKQFYVADTS